jgi:hypothetical protein
VKTLPLGLAHVASCSFLASRLAPRGEFFLALGGGVALARSGEKHGLRSGYGVSIAAIVQTVALIGPARVNAPLTQAISAPLMGWMQARGASRTARLLACLGLRLVHYAFLTVAAITIVVGGVDEYVDTYDKIADFLRVLPNGKTAAITLTIVGAAFYALLFSTIQTLVYERALRGWPGGPEGTDGAVEAAGAPRAAHGLRVWFAPGLVALAWIALLAKLEWVGIGAVAGVFFALTVFTRARKAGRTTWTVGVVLACVLAFGALLPAIIGAVDFEPAAQRAARAVLLVMSATWARAFAGSDGLREAARRTLWRLRLVPAAAEAARITEQLESDRELRPAATRLIDRLKGVEMLPLPLADALTGWVAAEAASYRPPGAEPPTFLPPKPS